MQLVSVFGRVATLKSLPVQVGNDQEIAQSERLSHSKYRDGKFEYHGFGYSSFISDPVRCKCCKLEPDKITAILQTSA